MNKLLLGFGLLCCSVISNAQVGPFGYFEDALRFGQSDHSLGSTARMQGIGGAQISLGGDISSASTNPAGLGFFNKSVFTISPSMNFTNVSTDYFIDREGQSLQGAQENFNNNFNIANVGAVINWNKGRFSEDKFKGGSLAISVNRANNYRLTRSYSGSNDFNSVADFIADNQGAIPESVFLNENSSTLGSFAYNNFLISPLFDASDDLIGYAADFEGFPFQSENIVESGSHYQMNVAWGGNYDDRLYFGAGTGFQFLNYSRSRSYRESDFQVETSPGQFDPDPKIDELFLDEEFSSRGLGINFNAGLIFRPVPFMTVGVSYTSPSFMTFDEEGFEDFEFYWQPGATTVDGGETISLDGRDGLFQSPLAVPSYNLRTPSRLGLGATLFIGKSGFLSGDLEFVDFSNASISSNDFIATQDNRVIDDIYTSVMNVRVGGEYRIDNVRLRAGYALLPSPYQNSNLNEQSSISFGIGYRNSDYFLDLAVVNRNRSIEYVPYESLDGSQPVAPSEIENTTVTVTWGINF